MEAVENNLRHTTRTVKLFCLLDVGCNESGSDVIFAELLHIRYVHHKFSKFVS